MLYIGNHWLCVLNNEEDKVKPMRKGKSSQVGRTGQAKKDAEGTWYRVQSLHSTGWGGANDQWSVNPTAPVKSA